MNDKKCLFVAVLGEPNAGKSTLVNSIVGEKVSIVSSKVQTTRRQIRGIVEIDNAQIIFTDTPGFCRPNTALERAIIPNFKHAHKDADMILLLFDATEKNHASSFRFLERFAEDGANIAVVINKTDVADKAGLLKLASKISKFVQQIFMISAKTQDGLSDLVDFLKNNAPDGPWLYDENQKTDQKLAFRLSEITREKVFSRLQKELPYNIYVETELFKETEKKARIFQTIVVTKDSQKVIVLGKGGDMISSIKRAAIADMKKILNKSVELRLFVKVRAKWTENRAHLQNAGIID